MEMTTMSVQELAAQMGIRLSKAYEFVKQKGGQQLELGHAFLLQQKHIFCVVLVAFNSLYSLGLFNGNINFIFQEIKDRTYTDFYAV